MTGTVPPPAPPAPAPAPAPAPGDAAGDPADRDVAARAWRAMRTLVLDRYDRRRRVCDALGMSFIRAKALRHIAGGPLTMRELAAGLGTDPPYTTVVVDDLERRGLVVRSVRPGDRRSKMVSITAPGREQAALAGQILAAPPRPVRELPAADLATLERILGQLLGPDA
jgi:DNA-binding MarR family transcriptional regulator